MNLTDLFNPQNIDIYVNPANDRHLDSESKFNVSDINLTRSVQSFDGQNLNIDANFINPTAISPLLTQDKLIFHFKGNISKYIYSSELN